MSIWRGIKIHNSEVKSGDQVNQKEKWSQFQKEMVAAVWGAMIYYTWQARNSRIFRKVNVDREFIFAQFKKEILDRLDILCKTKRARKNQLLIRSYVIRLFRDLKSRAPFLEGGKGH